MAGLNFTVDPNIVEPIIKAEIQAAIVAHLNNVPDLVAKLVQAAMADKVTESGAKSRSDYENKYLFIDVLCRQAIQEAARESMRVYITDNAPLFQAEMQRQLAKQKSNLAKLFVESLVGSMKSAWSFKVNVNLPGQE